MHRLSGFTTAVVALVAGYLVVAAIVLHQSASTPADEAAARLLGVLAGAAGIVAFCLLVRWSEGRDPAPGAVEPADGEPAPRSRS